LCKWVEGRKIFYEPQQFPFVANLEHHWQEIRAELEQLTPADFVEWPEKYLYGKGWDIFGLYAFGIKIGQNCGLCPRTTQLVEGIPDLKSAGFSALAPDTHITPHTGYPDGLLRCHLGLLVPLDCALRVGPETRTWQEGRCLVFDDTTEHEAWNRSTQRRIVLLLDFKAPEGVLPKASAKEKTGFLGLFKSK